MAVNPLTTTTTIGVITRYAIAIVGPMIGAMALLGWVDQATADSITEQFNVFVGALGTLAGMVVVAYAAWTKSNSDKASEVANEVDANVPPDAPVVIKTPEGVADIVVVPKV